MKQTIPFTKDITFKSKIGELTSISLDNDLTLKGEDLITGNFYISGTYKMQGTVLNPEKYSYKIPVEIEISKEYDTYDATIDIEDFEYETDEDVLKVKITVAINNLVKKEEEQKEEKEEEIEEKNKDMENELRLEIENSSEVIDNVPKKTFLETKEELKNQEDNYLTYSIYIVKEDDTLTSIKDKYKVSEEDIAEYNDINDFKPGIKLLIPSKETNL